MFQYLRQYLPGEAGAPAAGGVLRENSQAVDVEPKLLIAQGNRESIAVIDRPENGSQDLSKLAVVPAPYNRPEQRRGCRAEGTTTRLDCRHLRYVGYRVIGHGDCHRIPAEAICPLKPTNIRRACSGRPISRRLVPHLPEAHDYLPEAFLATRQRYRVCARGPRPARLHPPDDCRSRATPGRFR